MDELIDSNQNNLSVKTVAELLQTNEETVRRWIRDGKLQAEISSKKKGYTISAKQLAKFLTSTPSAGSIGFGFASMLCSMLLPLGMKSTIDIAETLAQLNQKNQNLPEEAAINNESLSDFLKQQIRASLEKISGIESQMMAVKAKIDAYHSVRQKNDSLTGTNSSASRESMSEYLTVQLEEQLQKYSALEQEMLMAREQLKAYQDSLMALEKIN